MRDLIKSDRNKLVIQDAISGGEVVLFYRQPTTTERVQYQTNLVRRKKGGGVFINHAARLDFGLKILTGFEDGSFSVDGKPISSDPSNGNYEENWKERLEETASDLIMILGSTVFEGARGPDADMMIKLGIDELEKGEVEEDVPFENS